MWNCFCFSRYPAVYLPRPVLFPMFLLLLCGLLLPACSREQPQRSACPGALGCVWVEPGEPVRIVSLQALSGELGATGQEYVRALELAAMDRNFQLLGHPIEIIPMDDGCSQAGGLIAARKIAADARIVAVHGTTCSVAAASALPVLSNAGFVLISGSATAPSLTSIAGAPGKHWRPGFFRTAHNDSSQGLAAASFAYNDLGLRRVATAHNGDPYSSGLVEVFEWAFQKFGGAITLSAVVHKGDEEMGPLLEGVVRSRAELLFFPLFAPEGTSIITQAASFPAFQGIGLMSADGLFEESFVKRIGEAGQGVYFVLPHSLDSPALRVHMQRYEAVDGETVQGVFSTQQYDAGVLLLNALEQAAFLETDGALRVDQQALRDALLGVRGFQGLTGSLSCDAFGDCGASRFKLVRIDNPQAGFAEAARNIIAVFDAETPSQDVPWP